MKSMKKLVSLLLTLSLLLTSLLTVASLTSCGTESEAATTLRVGVMTGPTGMGMAKLMQDSTEEELPYFFTVYGNPDAGLSDFAAGTIDMLCLPTNTAAALSVKQSDYLTVLALNCLGTLYVVTDGSVTVSSIQDLAGKTIHTSVANSTTKPILEFILSQNGITADIVVEKDHDTLVTSLAQGKAPIAVLPEPKVSQATLQNSDLTVALNLSQEWDKVSDSPLTMGCLVVKNDCLRQYPQAVNHFLTAYKASIEDVADPANADAAAQWIVSAGILPKLPIATRALANLRGSLVYQEGAEMRQSLTDFYRAIGQTQPDDSFFYEK